MWTPPADEVVQNSGGWTPPADERVDAPAPEEKTFGGLMGNAVSDAGQMASGLAQGVMHPIDTVKNVATHVPEIAHSMLHSWGLDSADSGHRMQTLGDEAYKHPVSHLMDAASVAIPGLKAAGIIPEGLEGANLAAKAGEAGESLEHTADLFRAKDLGARTRQFAEMGEDEAAHIGRQAKVNEITGSAADQLEKAKALDASEGKKVTDFRHEGDVAGAAPEHAAVMDLIKKQFSPKYTSGEHAGSAGEFQNALDSVDKLAPKVSPTIDMPAVEQVHPGAGPQSLFHGDDSSRLIPVTKDVPGIKQVAPDAGQMDFTPGELFPKEPYLSKPQEVMNHVPTVAQDHVPSLAGQQELMPTDPFASKLQETTHAVPNPAFDAARPNTSAFAKKATDLNAFASNEKSMLHPSNATTDVANTISAENDQALSRHLGSDKAKAYLESLAKESDAKKMTQMLEQKRARQLGKTTAPSSLPAQAWHGITDRFGYALTAKSLDKLAQVVRASPAALGKYGPALVNLGPAALATTAHLLMQNDPSFAQTLEKAGISQ